MFLLSRLISQAPEVLVTLLVFSLSTGVLGGTIFYLDSSGPEVMSEMSEEVLVDMEIQCYSSFYSQNETTLYDFEALVQNQEGIAATESVSVLHVYDQEIQDSHFRESVYLGINNTFLSSFPDAFTFESGISLQALNSSTCYLSSDRMLVEGLEIGDNFTISVPIIDGDGNQSRFEKTLSVVGAFESDLFQMRLTSGGSEFSALSMLALKTTLWTSFGDLPHEGTNSIHDRIWARFDKSEISRSDPQTIGTELVSVEKRIEQRILPYASVSRFPIVDVVGEYSAWAASMRVIAMAFAIPSIIMGLMLVYYNGQLLADQRRRDVGAIKTRGASGSQAFSWVLSVVVTTGIIGSIGAIAAGSAAAFLSGSIREFMVFDLSQLGTFVVAPLPLSVLALFLYSFVVGLSVGIPSAFGALLMTPAEAHGELERAILLEKEKMTNPIVLLAAVSTSGVVLLPIIEVIQSSTLSIFSSFIFALTLIILVTVFVGGLTMLLSRPAAILKSKVLTRIKKPSISIGARILGRTGRVFKKTETYSLMFIGLVFTATIFSSLAATTANVHMKELFQFKTGADIVVSVNPSLTNVTVELADSIAGLDGVANAAGMLRLSTHAQFWLDWYGTVWQTNRSTLVYGVQLDQWVDSAFILPYATYYNTPDDAFSLIKDEGTNVIGSFMPIYDHETNVLGQRVPIFSDSITLRLRGQNGTQYFNCSIVDVMASDPGGYRPSTYGFTNFYADTYFPGERGGQAFFVMDLEELQNMTGLNRISRFYVRIEEGANYTRVMEDIWALAPSSFTGISTPYDDIDSILNSRAGQSIYGAYTLNVLFSVLYLTAGVTLVVTVKIRSLRKHFSLLRALGTEPNSIAKAVLIDSLLGTALGLLTGIIVGLLVTIIMLQMPVMYLGLSSGVSWETLPLTLAVPYLMLILVVTTAIVFSLAVTWIIVGRSLSVDIADDLKLVE